MLSNKPVATTLPIANLDRAEKFYHDKLGLTVSRMKVPGYAMVKCGNGTELMLYERAPSHCDHTAASFEVDDIGAEMRELKSRGVVFEEYDQPGLKTIDGIAGQRIENGYCIRKCDLLARGSRLEVEG